MTNESEMLNNDLFEKNENPGVFEIAPGMTVEEMKAMYFDEDALLAAPERIYRLNSSGHRYYYKFDPETGEPEFFVSVTTMIKQTMPTSPYLIKWIADMGHDESKAFAAERADYGTFMHAQIADLLINRTYDLTKVKSRLKDFIESQQLPGDFINHADELKKDILAFAQFMLDTDMKPLAVEPILSHPVDGYAGALDIVCKMNIEESGYFGEVYKSGENKGQPKQTKRTRRVTAIIDEKSGRKGFFEEHEIQLKAYWEMWNIHYPLTPVEKVFNWAPKDWRGSVPTYTLKDQTDSPNMEKLPLLVQLARIEDNKRHNVVVATDGLIDLKANISLSKNITQFTLSELVKKRKEQEETPDETTEQATIEELAGEPAKTISQDFKSKIADIATKRENPQPTPEPEPKPEPKKVPGQGIFKDIDF